MADYLSTYDWEAVYVFAVDNPKMPDGWVIREDMHS